MYSQDCDWRARCFFFFSSRRRHTRSDRDWSSDVCSSDLLPASEKRRDRWAARTAQMALDRWPVAPGVLRRIVESTSDYIGIAHYWGQMCAFDPGRPRDQFIRRFNVPGAPVTDMGMSADPSWIRLVLNELRRLGKPV